MVNVKAAVDGVVSWFEGLPGRILAAIGSIDLSGIIKLPFSVDGLAGAGADAANWITEKIKAAVGSGDRPAGPVADPARPTPAPVERPAEAAPVRLDGNVGVTIKVDGPGKVTGTSNSNPSQIKVGSNGRMVGSV